MSSFKEIKERIGSVTSTRKITSAMKLVSASKLRKSQTAITGMLPYQKAMESVMDDVATGGKTASPLAEQRTVEHETIVVFSSNSSLCGAYNANIIRALTKRLDELNEEGLKRENVDVVVLGKKVGEAADKMHLNITARFNQVVDKPNYADMAELCQTLMDRFTAHGTDRVRLIYHHFRSAGSQVLTESILLPIELPEVQEALGKDYIYEPSREELMESLLPKSLKLKLFTALLDSSASEHAARVMAMQTATDNADTLIDELTIAYNKSRQQSITSELLDMFSGQQK